MRFIFYIFLIGDACAGLCRYHIKNIEQQFKIPQDLLSAIGIVESGKYSAYRKAKESWPWTVYAKGKGNFFQTKTQAQRFIEQLVHEGETNIDIGCMQINWHYHNKNFDSISDMLNPKKNITYAAKLLVGHYHKTADWHMAAGNYHSVTEVHRNKYLSRIKEEKTILQKAPRFVQPAASFKRWNCGKEIFYRSRSASTVNGSRKGALRWMK